MPDQTERRHRLALIGAGAIAREHVAAIEATEGLVLTTVVDRHQDRADRLAGAHGARGTTDSADLLADDVDGVVICTSPDSHVELATAALAAGKTVLLEKPVALSLASVGELLDRLQGAEGRLLVGQTARFQPAHLALHGEIESGAVGAPRMIHISWYTGHVWPGGWRGWQLNRARSGGHVVHNGVHALDLACWLMNDTPVQVSARPVQTWAADMPTPDGFHIIARFANGGLGVIELSYGLRHRGQLQRRVVVCGTRGTSWVDSDDEPADHAHPTLALQGVDGAMRNQYLHFRDVLDGRAAPVTQPVQIRGALAAALAAQQCIDNDSAWEDVSS